MTLDHKIGKFILCTIRTSWEDSQHPPSPHPSENRNTQICRMGRAKTRKCTYADLPGLDPTEGPEDAESLLLWQPPETRPGMAASFSASEAAEAISTDKGG